MKKAEFAKILERVRDALLQELGYGATPWDINNGVCDDFTDNVVEIVKEQFPGEKIVGVSMMDYDPDLSHTAIYWKGRLYDAECLAGVTEKNWKKLPIVANKGMTRAQALRRGYRCP